MAAQDTNSDMETPVESDSDSSLDLEIEADGVIRPFMFEPQRDTSEEDESDSNVTQEPPEAVEVDRRRGNFNRVLADITGAFAPIVRACQRKLKVFVARRWTFSEIAWTSKVQI